MLISKYLENPKSFNLASSLNYVVNVYNDTKHRSTLFKPNDIFYSDDPKLFKLVKNNILSNSKNYISNEKLFERNDSVLIFNNFNSHFIKNKNCYILDKAEIKKKNLLFNICATVLDVNNDGDNTIIIEKNYKEYGLNILNINDICIVKNNLLKKVVYEVWLKILSN